MQKSGFQFKKLVLGVIVVAVFVVYSFVARHNSSKSAVTASSSGDPSTTNQTTDPSSSGTAPTSNPSSSNSSGTTFKDGTYTGSAEDAFYGTIQVSAVISGGKLVEVKLLQYPNDNPHTQDVSNQSLPVLKQEAIQAQSANVNTVTGATDTSMAFEKSLAAALQQA